MIAPSLDLFGPVEVGGDMLQYISACSLAKAISGDSWANASIPTCIHILVWSPHILTYESQSGQEVHRHFSSYAWHRKPIRNRLLPQHNWGRLNMWFASNCDTCNFLFFYAQTENGTFSVIPGTLKHRGSRWACNPCRPIADSKVLSPETAPLLCWPLRNIGCSDTVFME